MRFSGISLVSSDVRRLRDFYAALFQVEPSGPADWWVNFETLPGGIFTIYHEQGMEEMAPGCMDRETGTGRFTIEIQVEDVDLHYERLKELEVPVVKQPTTQEWGRRSVWFRDPDGNIVNFYMDVPTQEP